MTGTLAIAESQTLIMAPIFRQALAKTALLEEMRIARVAMERILGGMKSGEADPAAGDELRCVLQAYLNVIRQAMNDIDARM